MTTRSPGSNSPVAAVTDLAAVLARGYLRLTEKRQMCATSGTNSGREKPLDVPHRESPHVVEVEQR